MIPMPLGGGAEVVPAILDMQSQPLDLSAPTPAALQTDVEPLEDQGPVDPTVTQCSPVSIIVA